MEINEEPTKNQKEIMKTSATQMKNDSVEQKSVENSQEEAQKTPSKTQTKVDTNLKKKNDTKVADSKVKTSAPIGRVGNRGKNYTIQIFVKNVHYLFVFYFSRHKECHTQEGQTYSYQAQNH